MVAQIVAEFEVCARSEEGLHHIVHVHHWCIGGVLQRLHQVIVLGAEGHCLSLVFMEVEDAIEFGEMLVDRVRWIVRVL